MKGIEGTFHIHAFTPEGKRYRLEKDTVLELFGKIQSRHDMVVKETGKSIFLKELTGFQLLNTKIPTTYITIPIKSITCFGIQIGTKYYSFQTKCQNTLLSISNTIRSSELKHAITDILETLVSYHTQGLHHNDIKSDNVMYCQNKYILIDYEKVLETSDLKKTYLKSASSEKESPYGSDFNTSPIALYIYGKSLKSIVNTLPIATFHTITHDYPFTLVSLSKYLDFFGSHVILPFTEYLENHKQMTRDQLFETFRFHFDVYAVGIMLAQLYFIRNGSLPKWVLDFATCLVNPLHPQFVYTAEDAYTLFIHSVK